MCLGNVPYFGSSSRNLKFEHIFNSVTFGLGCGGPWCGYLCAQVCTQRSGSSGHRRFNLCRSRAIKVCPAFFAAAAGRYGYKAS